MEFLDARRLTGPSLLFDSPAAVLDVACTLDEANALEASWRELVLKMGSALGWPEPDFNRVDLDGGVSLAFTAAIDALYAASAINEWVYAELSGEPCGDAEPGFDATLERLRTESAEEANQRLIELTAEAKRNGVTLLWDDDDVSLGLGRYSQTFPFRELPESVDWGDYHDVPIGLVTGTNGKTTTVRLATHILQGTGKNVGLSSTDWIAVNDRIIDRGDWSGPGGARAVLREDDVDVAVLESARGGLLRRGLGVERADASLITNIAEDHLGDFGSRSLAELLEIKWIVSRAVRDSGRLVLNADDELLVARANDYPGEIVWFSIDADNPVIRESLDSGGTAFVLSGDLLSMRTDSTQEDICKAGEIPIAMGGAARHNVANALAASALTWCLGIALEDIAAGLKSLTQDDNPGRCNLYDVDGRKVLVDFAHNPHAMRTLFDMAAAVPARRRVLCFGQAGDRPDDLIDRMTRDASAIGLDRVHVSELAQYHRGREHGEVFDVIRKALIGEGLADGDIVHFEEELEAFDAALQWAEAGDLVIMLALGGAKPVQERLGELGAI